MEEAEKRIAQYISGTLDLSNLSLYELPSLPDNVKSLDISGNFIQEVLKLPKNLKSLIAKNNRIKKITFVGVKKLIYLDLSYNNIECLDDSFDNLSMLKHLNIGYNIFTKIPNLTDKNLWELNIENNTISETSSLPESLRVFNCQNNKFVTLCKLPSELTLLDCSNNLLTELPFFEEECRIERLFCNNNKLKNLPDIPYSINNLNCSNNLLVELPTIVKIDYLNYKDNPLTVNPSIPSKFKTIKLSPRGDTDVRNAFHLELLPDCYDYEKDCDVPIKTLLSDSDNILIKIYDDFFGINRSKLLGDISDIDNILFLKDTNEKHIKTIMSKIVAAVDFEKFTEEEYSVYILSRTHHMEVFKSHTTEGDILGEQMVVHPFSLASYIEKMF